MPPMRDSPGLSPALKAPSLPDGLLRAVLDANPLPMWVEDEATLCILEVNDSALSHYGYGREQFLALTATALEAPEATSGALAASGVRHHRTADGRVIDMRLETRGVEVDGRPARLVVAIDVTGESRALAENARYRDLLDAAAEWVWEWDAAFRVSHLSPDFAASTGLLPQSFLGRRQEETAVTEATADQWNDHRATVAAHRRFRDFIFKVAGGDGRAVWLKIGGTPVFGADGAFRGYRGVGSNVTAQVEADQALRERERRFQQLFEAASDWYWEADVQGRLTVVSPNFEAMYGIKLTERIGRRLNDVAEVRFDAKSGQKAMAAIKARQPYGDLVYSLALPNGRTVSVRTTAIPMFEGDGQFCGYCGVSKDITAQVEAERALRERDGRFRHLFETASDWFWETDVQGRLTHVSPNFEALYGVAVGELLGRRLNELANAKIDPEMGRKSVAAMQARQPLRDIVYCHEFAGGRVVWAKLSGIPIFDSAGAFCGYWGMSKDITAEVEADRVLRESERQFKQVLEAAADYYYEQDKQYRFTYLSPGYGRRFPIEESIGKRLTDFSDLSVEPEMGKLVLLAQKTKQPYRDFVFSRKTPDGKKHWFKWSAAPLFDRDGRFAGYRGVGAEITQHVEAEAAARLAQQQRLEEAVAYVSHPIVVYDIADRAVAFNQAFTDLHKAPNTNTPVCQGASFREMAEWQLRVRFYGEGPDDAVIDLETLLARHQTEAEHTYHLRDDRWMLVVYRRLPGGGTVGLWTDVTALKRAEAERRALERQVHHSQRLEALGTLAGGVAHEINNALVPVIALTKMVAGKLPDDSRERRNLGVVVTGAERSRDLVKQILAFSRKEEEERRRESVDLGAVLREALQLMRATLPASIRVAEDIEPAPAITGDPSQLQQVIVNLMTNAAQAIGQEQGRITVSLRPDAGGADLRLSVADTGCGMDETTLARIFEPFFTTKPVGEGTGLGLSMVHGILKGHGGRIEVKSTPGQGTCFDLVLPIPGAQPGKPA
jgi:PAS domain S-box-containing protein